MQVHYNRLKAACYTTNIAIATVANFPPLLFLTFRATYGISYSLLGTLVLINFFTQLTMDLIFSFFSHKFNISLAVKMTPVLVTIGLVAYACAPLIFSGGTVYVGLVIGTLIFSAASGLSEVLISPVIAQIPADDPDREMSKLHSVYAWGVVIVVGIATVFFLTIGAEHWQWLTIGFALFPVVASILFTTTAIPKIPTPEKTSGAIRFLKNKALWLCVFAIFLGGASEVVMAQWSSSYLEQALGIPKAWGDVCGVALFGVALGFGRSLYAKMGENIERVLFLGAIGATACYLIAALSPVPVLGLIACAATGFFVSMLWPGSLIIGSEKFPEGGVFIYALMAAGGDCGASVGTQLVGVVTDFAMAANPIVSFAAKFGLTAEQVGMKLGMLVGMLFPLCAVFVYRRMMKDKKGARPLYEPKEDGEAK